MKQKRNMWIGLLLTVMMLVSMAMPAMAAGNGSITITNAVAGQTYNVYKIFDLESYSGTNYSYRIVDAWKGFDWEAKGITVDTDGYVTKVEAMTNGVAKANLAKDLLLYAENITPTKSVPASGTSVIIGELDLGYYLVDSSLGALCGLSTTAPNAEVTEKNSKPSIEKTVKEDTTGNFEASATADMGQEVEFKLTVNVGTDNGSGLGTGIDADFVITDNLPTGMSYVANSVAVEGGTSAWTGTDFTAAYTGDVLTITLNKEKLAPLSAETNVIVTYKATLDTDAVVAGTGNVNTATLTYNGYNTQPVSATVYTYQLSVYKFYAPSAETKNPLEGAVFTLKSADKTTELTFTVAGNNVYTYNAAATGSVTEITTDGTGKFNIQGLDAGTYYLTEKTAPTGFNKLTEDIEVIIAENGTVSYKMKANGETANADSTDGILVENRTGSILPSTGGMGTTIFYLAGAVLVITAGVLLITKKRMNSEEK